MLRMKALRTPNPRRCGSAPRLAADLNEAILPTYSATLLLDASGTQLGAPKDEHS